MERDTKQRHQFRYTAHPCENRDHATPTQRAVPQIVIIPRSAYPRGIGSCERIRGGSLSLLSPLNSRVFCVRSLLSRDRSHTHECSLERCIWIPLFLPTNSLWAHVRLSPREKGVKQVHNGTIIYVYAHDCCRWWYACIRCLNSLMYRGTDGTKHTCNLSYLEPQLLRDDALYRFNDPSSSLQSERTLAHWWYSVAGLQLLTATSPRNKDVKALCPKGK